MTLQGPEVKFWNIYFSIFQKRFDLGGWNSSIFIMATCTMSVPYFRIVQPSQVWKATLKWPGVNLLKSLFFNISQIPWARKLKFGFGYVEMVWGQDVKFQTSLPLPSMTQCILGHFVYAERSPKWRNSNQPYNFLLKYCHDFFTALPDRRPALVPSGPENHKARELCRGPAELRLWGHNLGLKWGSHGEFQVVWSYFV